MARKQLTYTDLRVALFVVATVILLAVGIFYVTGESAWQSSYTLKTYLPEADELVPGAPVSLGGVQVGSVAELSINPTAATPEQNIEVDLDIYKTYQPWIRANSTATLVTQGALGSRYVSLTRGTPPSAILQNNGTIAGVPASTIQTLVNHSTILLDNLNSVTVDLRSITDQIHSGKGTLGQLLYNDKLANQLNAAATNINDLTSGLKQGRGTAGKLLVSDQLYNNANSAIGRVDALLAAVQSQKGSLGKLIYDPSFANSANEFLTKGNGLLTNVEAGRGSLGKFATDPALYNNLNQASANLRDLASKMNQGQGTAGKFFTDPQLYDNLTGLTGDMRLLMGDFRRDPKKYLRIRVTLF